MSKVDVGNGGTVSKAGLSAEPPQEGMMIPKIVFPGMRRGSMGAWHLGKLSIQNKQAHYVSFARGTAIDDTAEIAFRDYWIFRTIEDLLLPLGRCAGADKQPPYEGKLNDCRRFATCRRP